MKACTFIKKSIGWLPVSTYLLQIHLLIVLIILKFYMLIIILRITLLKKYINTNKTF
jgi:hypothetical protein